MIWTFKLNFDVENLAFFCLATDLATFNKTWANHFPIIWSH
jgi:hypothetical protein